MRAEAKTVARPERLWDVVAAVLGWPGFVPTFASVTRLPGPDKGVGARYRVKQPGLRPATYEVAQWEEGVSFTWVARAAGVTTCATHTVHSDGAGARLELTLTWTGPLAPLVRTVLSGRAVRMMQVEAGALTRAAERPAAAATGETAQGDTTR